MENESRSGSFVMDAKWWAAAAVRTRTPHSPRSFLPLAPSALRGITRRSNPVAGLMACLGGPKKRKKHAPERVPPIYPGYWSGTAKCPKWRPSQALKSASRWRRPAKWGPSGKRHGMIKRSPKQIRQNRGMDLLEPCDAKIVKKYMPYHR